MRMGRAVAERGRLVLRGSGGKNALAKFLKSESNMPMPAQNAPAHERSQLHHSGAVALDQQSIRRILVCLDQSPLSEECLPYATFLAKTFRSPITLLHVMEPPHKRAEPRAFDAVGWEIARQEAVIYLCP